MGPMNLVQSIAISNDVYFYKLAVALGPEAVIDTARALGVGQRTGIDLPGESAGYLGTPDSVQAKGGTWYGGSTVILGIGQGELQVTPLQNARWTAAVATGNLVTPRLGLAIGTRRRARTPRCPRRAATPLPFAAALGPVREGMRAAVTGGTAVRLADLPVPVGAKTGTAQDGGLPDGELRQLDDRRRPDGRPRDRDDRAGAGARARAGTARRTSWPTGCATTSSTGRTSSPPARCRPPDASAAGRRPRAARRLRSARAAPSATQVSGSSASLTGRPRPRSSSSGKPADQRGPAEHQHALRQHVGERLRGEVVQARGERPDDLVGDRPHGVGHLGGLHRRQPRPAGGGVPALHDERAVVRRRGPDLERPRPRARRRAAGAARGGTGRRPASSRRRPACWSGGRAPRRSRTPPPRPCRRRRRRPCAPAAPAGRCRSRPRPRSTRRAPSPAGCPPPPRPRGARGAPARSSPTGTPMTARTGDAPAPAVPPCAGPRAGTAGPSPGR